MRRARRRERLVLLGRAGGLLAEARPVFGHEGQIVGRNDVLVEERLGHHLGRDGRMHDLFPVNQRPALQAQADRVGRQQRRRGQRQADLVLPFRHDVAAQRKPEGVVLETQGDLAVEPVLAQCVHGDRNRAAR